MEENIVFHYPQHVMMVFKLLKMEKARLTLLKQPHHSYIKLRIVFHPIATAGVFMRKLVCSTS